MEEKFFTKESKNSSHLSTDTVFAYKLWPSRSYPSGPEFKYISKWLDLVFWKYESIGLSAMDFEDLDFFYYFCFGLNILERLGST